MCVLRPHAGRDVTRSTRRGQETCKEHLSLGVCACTCLLVVLIALLTSFSSPSCTLGVCNGPC